MKRILTLAAIAAAFGVLMATATASAQQDRDEVMVVIPMDYMSAAVAAGIFGGAIVEPSPMAGQRGIGARGTTGDRSSFGTRGTIGDRGGFGARDGATRGFGTDRQRSTDYGSPRGTFDRDTRGFGQDRSFQR